ncbi:PQQ-binding-like beta-propeller repeat protein [Paenibacillus sp. OV219]|uniref:outer membrane protein assembly factor BamB family protein n=1 Tax=Paenibacillus sp. OV219 TaxID=1884377 RepID=UPI0008BE8E7E|nr:PQQ-binding-like beta-propeller repeat protein [Paenibacillus sp. OV219]SEO76187.1 Outer membrane protein assembly factor BamB, contains PQQ-like beta-propeller repeat [Paenibacillus sp. OV219]
MNNKFKPKHKLFGLLAAALLTTCAAQGAAAQTASNTSYSTDTMLSSENKVPGAKPLWTAELDKPTAENREQPALAVANGNLYYVAGGVLHARSAKTGKQLWTYGSKLKPGSAVVVNGSIYVSGQTDNSIYRVDAAGKGKRVYQLAKGSTLTSFSIDGTTLYLSTWTGLSSVNLTTGKENWRSTQVNSPSIELKVGNKLLIPAVESGAITVGTLYAIDSQTGRTIWRLSGSHSQLLKAEGTKLYMVDDWPKTDSSKYVSDIDVIDANTGSIISSKSFVPIKEGLDPLGQYPNDVTMVGDNIYVSTRDNELYQYHFNADQATVRPSVLNDNGQWIFGPYNGKLFYLNSDNIGIHARKLADQTAVYYEGLDNPASQVDFINSGIFVGQTDGEVYALNVTTGKALFRYQTPARSFGEFQVSGSQLLVQAEGKLYAFALPAELTKPLSVSTPESAYKKAVATLSLNGKNKPINPSMMTINNRMLVPLRFLSEELGATGTYDAIAKQAVITLRDRTFTIKAGVPYAETGTGKEQVALVSPPVVLNNSLYLPISDAGSLLGVKVVWNGGPRTVEVTTG